VDSLLLRHSVLTLECRSESDLGRGTTGMVTPIMGIIRIPTIIGRTLTITMGGLLSIGLEAIDITATIVTITTAGIKAGDVGLNPLSWLVIRASSFFFAKTGLLSATHLSILWG
jgi:hypothetical protein